MVKVANGKYEVLHENGANLRALRYGEPWRDLCGDGLVLALVQRIEALEADCARLDWIEAEAKVSNTGVSFDYVRHTEDGLVVEQGIRFMRFHFLGERQPTIRKAIDSVRP